MTIAQMKNEKPKGISRDDLLYFVTLGIFFALIVAKDLVGMSVPLIVYTAIWLFIILYFDVERAAAFTICSTICFASTLSVTIPILVFTVIAFLHGTRKFYAGCFLSAVAIIIAEMTHFRDAYQNFKVFVNMSMFILLIVVVATIYLVNDYDPCKVLKHYLGFFVILATDIFIYTVRGFGSIAAILGDSFRIGQTDIVDETVTSIAMSINANGMAFLALMAVAIALVLLNQKQISKKIAIPVIIYCSFIGALTISKTFVICYAVLIVVFYFWYLIAHSKNVFSGIGIALLVVAAFILFSFTNVYQNIQFRFENGDLTTGRADIFAGYMGYMSNHPDKWLFGVGLQYPNIKAGIESVPHNAFLETYVCLGIVGLIVVIFFFCNLFYLFRRRHILVNQRKPKILNYIPFFIYLFFIQTFQFLRVGYISVTMVLAFLCIIVQQKDNVVIKPENVSLNRDTIYR